MHIIDQFSLSVGIVAVALAFLGFSRIAENSSNANLREVAGLSVAVGAICYWMAYTLVTVIVIVGVIAILIQSLLFVLRAWPTVSQAIDSYMVESGIRFRDAHTSEANQQRIVRLRFEIDALDKEIHKSRPVNVSSQQHQARLLLLQQQRDLLVEALKGIIGVPHE